MRLCLVAACVFVLSGCGDCSNQGTGRASPADTDGSAEPLQLPSPAPEQPHHVDPYCGMRLREGEAAATFEHRGTTYYFCLADHMEAFSRDPERYLSQRNEPPSDDPDDGGIPGTADAAVATAAADAAPPPTSHPE